MRKVDLLPQQPQYIMLLNAQNTYGSEVSLTHKHKKPDDTQSEIHCVTGRSAAAAAV